MDSGLLDDIIERLRDGGRRSRQVLLAEAEVGQLCIASEDIFLRQPNLLELDPPIKICGDILGQYPDLIRLFEYGGFPPSANYLFLGNYVNHGKQSLETICLLLAYKIKYPENFFLLRGNHECASVTRIHGFYDECKRRYNIRLWKTFIDCFNCLPVAAVIDDKILCVQGGLSPDLKSLNQIKNIPRPTDVPDSGLLCDLLWSDPAKDQTGWGINNDRGVSYTFGADKVQEFLEKHDLDLLCRGHQVVEGGYEFFANRQMVTIFSAPNFCGAFDNAGAMMSVDETLMCSFRILKPSTKEVAEKLRSTARSEALAAAPSEKLMTPETPPARNIAQPVKPETLRAKNTPQKAVASPPHKNKTRPVTPAHRRTSRSISPFRMNMSRPKTPPRMETQRPVTPHKQVASPPHKSKTRPVTPARKTSGSISPFRFNMSRPKTPSRKETQRPVTPETLPAKNTPQKPVASPPHKNKTRPITPARRRTSRSISPFRMNMLRPKTPPRKVTQRPVTPFRQ